MPDPVHIAAQTAWGEARDQGSRGMHAVLSVIGNRVRQPGWWGHDITSVCLAQNRGIHQFSCWNAHDPNRARINAATAADPELAAATLLARQLAAGDLADITDGADSYCATSLLGTESAPSWATSDRLTTTIGAHAFYRIGVDGHAAAQTASGVTIA